MINSHKVFFTILREGQIVLVMQTFSAHAESGIVSNVISTSLLKLPLSPGYLESCSKFSSKAHFQAATQLQLSGAILKTVAGYSTAPSGGDKGKLSCRA